MGSTFFADVNNQLNFQQFSGNLVCLATSDIADCSDEFEWNIFVVLHSDFDCHEDPEFLFRDEVQILL